MNNPIAYEVYVQQQKTKSIRYKIGIPTILEVIRNPVIQKKTNAKK